MSRVVRRNTRRKNAVFSYPTSKRPVKPGLSDVKVAVRARSDADSAALQEVLDAVHEHSPVFDSLSRPIEVQAALSTE